MPEIESTTGADRTALVALAVSLTVLFSCVPVLNCLIPLVPIVMGIMALMQAQQAANPARARMYGWIATGIGALIVLGTIVIIIVYGAMFMATFDEMQRTMPH